MKLWSILLALSITSSCTKTEIGTCKISSGGFIYMVIAKDLVMYTDGSQGNPDQGDIKLKDCSEFFHLYRERFYNLYKQGY